VVHEKLYHIFVVSQDLTFFLHTHPDRNPDEDFHLDVRFPKPGMYRVLSDFYPSGGTPQLITNTVMVPGNGFVLQPASIRSDMSPRQTENSRVELQVIPQHIIARQKVSMLFRVTPGDGLEPYLGAWGHMLAASSDLVDMMHNHSFQAIDGRVSFQRTPIQRDLSARRHVQGVGAISAHGSGEYCRVRYIGGRTHIANDCKPSRSCLPFLRSPLRQEAAGLFVGKISDFLLRVSAHISLYKKDRKDEMEENCGHQQDSAITAESSHVH
jgi:hypothetical protein